MHDYYMLFYEGFNYKINNFILQLFL